MRKSYGILGKVLLSVCIGMLITNAYAVSVGGIKGGSHENTNFESLGDNDVGGTAASGWSFQSATASPAEYKDASCTSSTTGTFTKSGKTFNFVSFTVTVSGIILPSGPGNGPCPTDYTISASRQNPGFNIEPPEAVIKAGDSCTFTAKESMSVSGVVVYGNKNSNWTISSNGNTSSIVQNVSSVNVGTAWWNFFHLYYDTDTPAPGSYTITATTSADSEPVSAQAQLTVVGVEKLQENSTGAFKDVPTAALLIEKDKSLELKAFPYPAGTWPENTPVWSSSGSWWFTDHILGNDTGVDTVSIDTSGEDDIFTVTAACGTSNKSVEIKTFNYRFAIYVYDPTWGDVPFSIVTDIDVGHTWWKLYLTNDVTPADVDLAVFADYINTPVGYWPVGGVGFAGDLSADGELRLNDTAHSPNASKDVIVTRANFISGLNYTKGVHSAPGTYVAAIRVTVTQTFDPAQIPLGTYCATKTEKNCTTVAVGAASATVVSVPSAYQTYSGTWWTLLGFISADYEGHNPSRLASGL